MGNNSRKFRKSILGGRSRWYYLLRGVILSVAITIPVFLIISIAVTFTSFPEELLPPSVLVTTGASIIAAAFFSTWGAKNSGWFNGTLVGLIYITIPIILRWIMEKRIYFDKDVITMLLCGILIGSVSGMAALNYEKIKKKT